MLSVRPVYILQAHTRADIRSDHGATAFGTTYGVALVGRADVSSVGARSDIHDRSAGARAPARAVGALSDTFEDGRTALDV